MKFRILGTSGGGLEAAFGGPGEAALTLEKCIIILIVLSSIVAIVTEIAQRATDLVSAAAAEGEPSSGDKQRQQPPKSDLEPSDRNLPCDVCPALKPKRAVHKQLLGSTMAD